MASSPHSMEALRRLEARGGWDEADLNDFAILEGLVEQLETLQQKCERQATNIGALYRQRRGCETVLISIAEWVEEHYREGDKEYQLALIARAASPATEAGSNPASDRYEYLEPSDAGEPGL